MCVNCLYMVENPYVLFVLEGRFVYDVLSRLANMYVMWLANLYAMLRPGI